MHTNVLDARAFIPSTSRFSFRQISSGFTPQPADLNEFQRKRPSKNQSQPRPGICKCKIHRHSNPNRKYTTNSIDSKLNESTNETCEMRKTDKPVKNLVVEKIKINSWTKWIPKMEYENGEISGCDCAEPKTATDWCAALKGKLVLSSWPTALKTQGH